MPSIRNDSQISWTGERAGGNCDPAWITVSANMLRRGAKVISLSISQKKETRAKTRRREDAKNEECREKQRLTDGRVVPLRGCCMVQSLRLVPQIHLDSVPGIRPTTCSFLRLGDFARDLSGIWVMVWCKGSVCAVLFPNASVFGLQAPLRPG